MDVRPPLAHAAPSPRPGSRRAIAILAGALVFLGVASLIKPQPRAATATPGRAPIVSLPAVNREHSPRSIATHVDPVSARLAQTRHPNGWKLLGQLEGREYRVLMFASPEGPRYSVYTLDGSLLMPDLVADDVYRAFPDLDLTPLRDVPADKGQTLMLADPQE